MCRCHLISVPFLWNKDFMRKELDSLALALPMPLFLDYYTRIFLAHFLLDVYSVSLGFPPLPNSSISLGLTAFDSTGGHICLYLKHVGLGMILGLRSYIFNWEKNNNTIGFTSKLMMNTGLNMLVQSVHKSHLLSPSAYRQPVALSFGCC